MVRRHARRNRFRQSPTGPRGADRESPCAAALLIGPGGAGSSIAIEVIESGVRELVIYDPDSARVESLVQLLNGLGSGIAVAGPLAARDFDLVFNASPLGMKDDDPLPADLSGVTSRTFVGDVISGHGTTTFLAAAQARGCGTAGGSAMVVAVQQLMLEFFMELR